jgi:hypothetical protein
LESSWRRNWWLLGTADLFPAGGGTNPAVPLASRMLDQPLWYLTNVPVPGLAAHIALLVLPGQEELIALGSFFDVHPGTHFPYGWRVLPDVH